MTQGERIKELRKALGLTLEKFGDRLGVTKVTISRIEKEERNLTDQMALSICREYGVNEEWLRSGYGEMFKDPTTFSLDEYAVANNLSETEISIIRRFMELDPKTRQTLYNVFSKASDENKTSISDESLRN